MFDFFLRIFVRQRCSLNEESLIRFLATHSHQRPYNHACDRDERI